jgi:hypothetical protein
VVLSKKWILQLWTKINDIIPFINLTNDCMLVKKERERERERGIETERD